MQTLALKFLSLGAMTAHFQWAPRCCGPHVPQQGPHALRRVCINITHKLFFVGDPRLLCGQFVISAALTGDACMKKGNSVHLFFVSLSFNRVVRIAIVAIMAQFINNSISQNALAPPTLLVALWLRLPFYTEGACIQETQEHVQEIQQRYKN